MDYCSIFDVFLLILLRMLALLLFRLREVTLVKNSLTPEFSNLCGVVGLVD